MSVAYDIRSFPGCQLQVQVEFDPPVGNKAAVAICDNSIYGLYKLRNPNRVRYVMGVASSFSSA